MRLEAAPFLLGLAPIGLAVALGSAGSAAGSVADGFRVYLLAEGVAVQSFATCTPQRRSGTFVCRLAGEEIDCRDPKIAVRTVVLPARGRPSLVRRCLDRFEPPPGQRQLIRGQRWRSGAIACRHEVLGSGAGLRTRLSCANDGGHGFSFDGLDRLTTR